MNKRKSEERKKEKKEKKKERKKGRKKERKKQVTRGHNIVADGWAGASNPHPHPNPPPTLKHAQKVSKTLVFPLFNSMTMTDQRTNGRTDGRTDGRTKPLIELRVRN